MDFVVDTGEGFADAISYVTGDFVIKLAVGLGRTVGNGDPDAAAAAGSLWLDATFGHRYPGERTHGRAQGMLYPRKGGTDRAGDAIPEDVIPVEIKRAAALAALREMDAPGSLAPDVAAGGAVKRKREELGPMKEETEYAVTDGARAPAPWFPEIAGALAPLIGDADPSAPTWFWR